MIVTVSEDEEEKVGESTRRLTYESSKKMISEYLTIISRHSLVLNGGGLMCLWKRACPCLR